ncbi:hypothetical protein H0H87_007390 [Tephrocybe sp. NHM501043]|nr:hypothetical protein H0H87_007390 [Tephrocybe sp. NHM501043]
MFSSFVSFLPSLHLPNSNSSSNIASASGGNKFEPTDTPEEEEACKQEAIEEDAGAKKGKTKGVNETFIIVRPPPAKSNHPLNLQVQLVPPTARNTRQSVDESDGGNSTSTSGVSLTRTASNRSDTSSYTSYGSTASFSSTASASSTRRTIIPLYSLQAHNVLPNVIVDAGTDAKIAKFNKRGIELVDLAVLEPVEVWSEPPKGVPSIRTSRPATPDPATHPTTADSSVVSLTQSHTSSNLNPNSTTRSPHTTPISLPPTTPSELSGNGSSKRNLFGKMFKKKDNLVVSPPVSPIPSRFSPSNSPLQLAKSLLPDPSTTPTPRAPRGHTRNLSAAFSPEKLRHRSSSPNPRALGLGLLQVPSLDDSPSQHGNGNGGANNRNSLDVTTPTISTPNPANDDGKILRPPVLGIQPTLSYSFSPAGGVAPEPVPIGSLSKSARALMHVWFVRKWFKRRADDTDAGGLLGMMQGASHSRPVSGRGSGFSLNGGSSHAAAGEGVEVRFEWKRNSAKGRARKVRGRRGGKGEDAETGRSEKGKGPRPDSRRQSLVSHHSVSTNLSTSEDGRDRSRTRDGRSRTRDGEREQRRSFAHREEDDGEESDPEDSETPWTCTLKIRRTGAGTTGSTFATRSRRASTMHQGNGSVDEEIGAVPPAPQVLRLKVGTLSPTPHHPKVVAMLKVPFPLPDVEVERMTAVKRSTVPGTASQWEGLALTAEEIKDIVCSTAMWVVVREGFGGVGKVSRKGDGWRIRA